MLLALDSKQWRNKRRARGHPPPDAGPGGRPWLLFNFFLLKNMDGLYRRTQGGHGAIAPPLALALWIPIRVVKISDTGVSFFDKKTSLN